MPPKVLHHLRNESTVPCGNGNEAAWCMRSQPHPTSLAPAALLLRHCAPWLLAHLGGFANVPHPVASLVYCRGTSSWGCKVSCEKYIELRENQRKGSEKSKVRSQGLCALGPPRARVCGVGVTSLYTGAPLAPRPELPATPCPEGRRGQQELERWGDGWPCEESSRLD